MEALHILADQFLVKSLTKYFFVFVALLKNFCTVPLIDKKHTSLYVKLKRIRKSKR